jgi:hypothetical protein
VNGTANQVDLQLYDHPDIISHGPTCLALLCGHFLSLPPLLEHKLFKDDNNSILELHRDNEVLWLRGGALVGDQQAFMPSFSALQAV